MPTGDEPQLGGQDFDNAQGDYSPMISGRGTQIIVSARGAYVAGNLRALIDAMNQQQHRQFHQAVIAQALWYLERIVNSENAALLSVLEEIKRWLQDHDPAHLTNARTDLAAGQVNAGELVRVEEIAYSIIECAADFHSAYAAAEFAELAAHTRVIAEMRGGHLNLQQERRPIKEAIWLAQRWQIEAAWALLQRRAIPPLETFSGKGQEHAHSSGDLAALFGQMDASQMEQFREILLAKALEFIGKVPPRDPKSQNLLELTERTVGMQGQNESMLTECRLALDDYKIALNSEQPSDWAHLHPALYFLEALLARNPKEMANQTYLAVQLTCKELPGGIDWMVNNPFQWWQVETAWAILHGESIPPYEFEDASAG